MRTLLPLLAAIALAGAAGTRAVEWRDLPGGTQRWLRADGLDERQFPAWRDEVRAVTARRIREGDADHLIAFALQSRTFTPLPPVEPAISARRFVELGEVPPNATARLAALASALSDPEPGQPRLAAIRELAGNIRTRTQLEAEYARSMRFLYEKEFVARDDARKVAALYRIRGLSTDSALEAGYAVREGLATLAALEPSTRIRSVAIVGPGVDIAPRTGLDDELPPQSLQPFAVMDALARLGLGAIDDLEVACLDVNPRVTRFLERASREQHELLLLTGFGSSDRVTMTGGYSGYVASFGNAIGTGTPVERTASGRLRRMVRLRKGISQRIHAQTFDAVTERIDRQFDLVVVTNVFPYFDDRQLAVALAGIRAMLKHGGVLLHNEARVSMDVLSRAAGLPLLQGRTVMLATVKDGAPLYDSVWLHRAR